ncbi:hypothetical protein BpHYR1_002211 [Brachionus plicatilis]|uniref:Uncharacterized protein n=1 Tax=Brachionus plicatilis TaxID=10195 RepID=A0A3M7SL58_BRAPC|nr:hypothetical protein BpHYR1_002211 [Brachionus plicatilis]
MRVSGIAHASAQFSSSDGLSLSALLFSKGSNSVLSSITNKYEKKNKTPKNTLITYQIQPKAYYIFEKSFKISTKKIK